MAIAAILVIVGGAIGSALRYWGSGFVAQRAGETFPYGTLVVNVVGSLFIGAISAFVAHLPNADLAGSLQQFLAIGVCGGLTTFSSFSLQSYNLLIAGRWMAALLNILLSTGFCLISVAIGWHLVNSINL